MRVEEVKYAGPGGGHRRKLVDDLEEKLSAGSAKLERARTKAERAAAMLIAVKAGVKHLADKAAPAQHDLGLHIPEVPLILRVSYPFCNDRTYAYGCVVRNDRSPIVSVCITIYIHTQGEVTDETVGLVLAETEKVLFKLLLRVRAARAEEVGATEGAASDDALLRASRDAVDMGDLEDSLLAARPHNQRIELPSLRHVLDEDEDEGGEEALSRDKVKRASNVVLPKEETKATKKKEQAAY